MHSAEEGGPVYYREIQKNAYLKRIPNESGGSKLLPLGQKKPPPLKPMWTMFCVHNGRTPYLEQYPDSESPSTLAHRPTWRACLRTARHVTASVKPHRDHEYDFLIDTDEGAVRMLAPNWESMQDWVTTLRNKLQELKIMCKTENVYCPPPVLAAPRAGSRDPTSPLPPTPAAPRDIVPGIEPVPPRLEPTNPPPQPVSLPPTSPPRPSTPPVDISSWDNDAQPSTSQEPPRSLTRINGQTISLDDSILKRSLADDDDEGDDYTQKVVVSEEPVNDNVAESDQQSSNVTVIKVSNKDPPHTAIPVLSPETNVFDFNFKQKLSINHNQENSFVNIVNTEAQNENYDTVFDQKPNSYGHVSLMTTVSLTGETSTSSVNEGVYERLCLASTSNANNSPLPLRRLMNEKERKASLPNLESTESAYEYLFPAQNNNRENRQDRVQNGRVEVNSNHRQVAQTVSNVDSIVSEIRPSGERSHSQNAYDVRTGVRERLVQNAKREVKTDKKEQQAAKPIWRRGLTELSLLTRLRGNRQASPNRSDRDNDRNPTVPVKVVQRSRPEARGDNGRRRSSSLSNGQPQPSSQLQSLRTRQALCLMSEQRRGALVHLCPAHCIPLFVDKDAHVWIARWPSSCPLSLCGVTAGAGRPGDRVLCVRGIRVNSAPHAVQAWRSSNTPVSILFHRLPLAKIYVLNKRDREGIGIKLDNECNIVSVEADSAADRAGIPPPGKWAVTEVNNRPLNLLKGGEDDMNRLSLHGDEVSVLIQPSHLVKKLRAALKASKSLLPKR